MLDQNGTRKEQSVCHMATQIENMVLTKLLKSFGFLPKLLDQEGTIGGHVASLERWWQQNDSIEARDEVR